ncbi:VOC family protein [Chloroflexota bacterium]
MSKGKSATVTDIEHIGIVVQDIEKAAHFYSVTLGTTPFRIFELNVTDEMLQGFTQGKTSTGRLKIGIAQKGNLIFELIEIVEGRTVYQEFIDDTGSDVHLGFDVDDLNKAMAQFEGQGIEVFLRGDTGNGEVAFIGGEGTGNVLIELMQPKRSLLDRLASIEEKP